MKSAVAIIATRPESKRLPRKAFMPIAGIPAIEHILYRLIPLKIPVILAIPSGCIDYDYLIQKFNREMDISIFTGYGESPLHRIHYALGSLSPQPDYVIRITHDDILIDIKTIQEMLDLPEEYGYAYSPDILEGAGVEIIHKENLTKAVQNRDMPTEYVSYFVKSGPYEKIIRYEPNKSVCRDYRMTMDYYEDWIVLDTVLKDIGPFASIKLICSYLDDHPNILNWNRMPEVTFYTCVHNGEETIGETISSILSQQGNYEYIIVDDFSSDNTIMEITRFTKNNHIRLFKNINNIGLASSSNIALSKAKGNYVVRVDADDILMDSYLSKMLPEMKKTHTGIIYPGYIESALWKKAYSKIDKKDPRAYHHAGCAMMDKRMINEIRFKQGLRHWDSLDLYNRIKKQSPVHYIDDPLWIYQKSQDSMSSNMTDDRKKALKEID